MIIIDGKAVSSKIKSNLKETVSTMQCKPCLAVVRVGDDPASIVYVRNKNRACEEIGIKSKVIELPENTNQEELLCLIDELNNDEDIDGILVQLPVPKQIDKDRIIMSIRPDKDVDAFHPINVGNIVSGKYSFLPCTPAGIMELLYAYDINPDGKNCVVIGRSNIVGKPMSLMLLNANATVTTCHSHTGNIKEILQNADIIVSAVGKTGFVKVDMVKEGAIVIDVGMNRDNSGKLCGDVDFDGVKDKVSYITPVPGGVGPMTVAMLMKNTVNAAIKYHDKK